MTLHEPTANEAGKLPADTPAMPAKVARKSRGKARLLTIDSIDGRTLAARRAHELIEAIEADLGGRAHLTTGARQLIQRAAILGTYIESCEARWLAGQPVELLDYLSAVNNQRRVLATIGLERRARTVVPSLEAYIAERASPP
jgi:hypothetical protein